MRRDDRATVQGPRAAPAAESRLQLVVFGEGNVRTFALPEAGTVVIGRTDSADIALDDPSTSRNHAAVHVGERIELEDLQSANGTLLRDHPIPPGTRVELTPGEIFCVGLTQMLVQRVRSMAAPRVLWTPAYFDGRLAEACARAELGVPFSLVRVEVPGRADEAAAIIAGQQREDDVLSSRGPGEYALLLPRRSAAEATALATDLEARLGAGARCSVASCPDQGRTPEALWAAASRGPQASPPGGDAVVIADPAMRRLYGLVDRIAVGSIHVLVVGETGTGKEVLSEAIHRRSPRAKKPYVRLNCAAFSETLLESELMGYEKGAFTGATQAKPGLIETADGGTVLLDEVGELPLLLQPKLLRVIDAKQVLRVGGLKPRDVDVRFVAATNRDLEAEVAAGRFRQDLYYRLNGFLLQVPPLRERPSEILALARSFAAQAAERLGRRVTVSERALELLLGYPWPGNIRELKNVIERAVLLCTGDALEPEHLPAERMGARLILPAPRAAMPIERLAPPSAAVAAPSAEGGDERQRIIDALAACAGNQTQAAVLLGIKRRRLVALLERYDLPRPRRRD